MNNDSLPYQQEDEIDLRELWKILVKKKWFILIFTCLLTLGAVIFVLLKTPIYEAVALVEIGEYTISNANTNSNSVGKGISINNSNTNSNTNTRIKLDNAAQLVEKLNILYIDMVKNKKNREADISSIALLNKQNNFIEIKSLSVSNELAVKEIQKVVSYIQSVHQKILDDVKQRMELEIKNFDTKISNIKKKDILLLEEKISFQDENLKDYKNQLALIDQNLKKIEILNPALAALTLIGKKDISTLIVNVNLQLMDMRNAKEELETTAINDLYEKKNLAESMLLPHNFKNSEIVGAIITNDYPIKPKKKLIVVVAFVTGLILSIFSVFFLNFIKSEED